MQEEDNNNYYQNNNTMVSRNDEFLNTTIIQLRLNTESLLKDIELYLKGSYESVTINEQGLATSSIIQVTNQMKANDIGIYSIMSWLRATINSQVVQGNFEDFETLHNYLENFRVDFTTSLMVNIYIWDVNEYDFEGIIDMIMTMIYPFMSRLVGNEERNSYTASLKMVEKSDTLRAGKKAFPFL